MRKIIAGIASVLLAAGLSFMFVTSASALTTRGEVSYEGGGNDLVSTGALYSDVEFQYIPASGWSGSWDYQALGTSGGSTYYYIHPHGHDSYCLTVNTSNYANSKIETCDDVWNQFFHNPNDTHGDYRVYSAGGGVYLNDPGNPGTTHWAGFSNDEGYGYNGQTFYEPA